MSRKERKSDPRVIRSRQLLRAALISLIPEKGFGAISVQDIADRATLNRATFYLHYQDKTELLMDAFEELIAHATPLPPEDGLPDLASAPASIERVFNRIAEHADFFRVMLAEENVPAFAARYGQPPRLVRPLDPKCAGDSNVTAQEKSGSNLTKRGKRCQH